MFYVIDNLNSERWIRVIAKIFSSAEYRVQMARGSYNNLPFGLE